MRIAILCSSEDHPVNTWLEKWVKKHSKIHEITLVRKKSELQDGDILFLISSHEIIDSKIRNMFGKCLVIHASDLPTGRGWSPHIWQIIEGRNEICVSLLEAVEKVDEGPIWCKKRLNIPDTALYDEINELLFNIELDLMDYALEHFGSMVASNQDGTIKPTYYPKRKPLDSEIDPSRSIAEQFDLLRVSDPQRYPAFFKFRGQRYKVILEKWDEPENSN